MLDMDSCPVCDLQINLTQISKIKLIEYIEKLKKKNLNKEFLETLKKIEDLVWKE